MRCFFHVHHLYTAFQNVPIFRYRFGVNIQRRLLLSIKFPVILVTFPILFWQIWSIVSLMLITSVVVIVVRDSYTISWTRANVQSSSCLDRVIWRISSSPFNIFGFQSLCNFTAFLGCCSCSIPCFFDSNKNFMPA